MLSCDCPTCKPPSKLSRNHELGSPNDVTMRPSTLMRATETSSMSLNFDYEPAEQSEAKAEKEGLIKSVNSQITGKPEIKTANIGCCSKTYILFPMLSCLILLHLCH
uniref:Uncharacterized protein n=1 Tax=Elaeophora elaphi TaxID=1147741 RepID=A0A0R3RHR6_9BILA